MSQQIYRYSDTFNMDFQLLTGTQTASILGIHEHTINILVRNNRIPYAVTNGIPRFTRHDITEWLTHGHILSDAEETGCLDNLKAEYAARFPKAISTLQQLDAHYAEKRGKGFSLSKVPSKRYGFLYYTRYIENGKLIPSRWNTRTNDLASAEQWARDNRERILREYHKRKEGENKLYGILERYYEQSSKYLSTEANRGRVLTKESQRRYYRFINGTLIPYLKAHSIRSFTDITQPEIAKLQDFLLAKGNKPQTINKLLCCVRLIFDFLVKRGEVQTNPFWGVTSIKVNQKDRKVRGCYEIDSLKGVFDKKWNNDLSFLLCLLVYTTNMRNSEINRIQLSDIITIGKRHFINIPKSKTDNGVRIVPLHPYAYEKLMWYAQKYRISDKSRILNASRHTCRIANTEMGRLVKKTPDELDELNITFCSGRSFWKTVMNFENLGDVEEYFMGHKVSSNVAKLYNHKDKIGRSNILTKAEEVFKALDKYLFKPQCTTASQQRRKA